MTLTAEHFDDFFQELWGKAPYPWQRRLARQVCGGHLPRFIDLPTASGKTACLDVAVFALAVQAAVDRAERTVGRRIFLVVNRRVIVDEAYDRALEIARKLSHASTETTLYAVAQALRRVSGQADAPPLDVALLRGGIVRDNRWARSITQPTLITSTIDQVGSRLLFRGYGVSPEAAPLHAALIAHDSLILLDESHISQPFVQTLESVRNYRGEKWAHQPVRTPFQFVQMTATPGDVPEQDVFRLNDEDRESLQDRHGKAKPVELRVAEKAKGKKAFTELAKELAERAVKLQDDRHRNTAVVVNRIGTAREVYGLLQKRFGAGENSEGAPAAIVELAIGRMRPLDRDDLTSRVQNRVGQRRKDAADDTRPLFVVATQCLEVGADFDFDAMVSECASLDALRQRFGRLNRTGRDIDAKGCVVVRADQVADEDDPIYGSALANTWAWLQSVAVDGCVDFSVNALDAALAPIDELAAMLAPRPDAPVMFPAYLDMWGQTSPAPEPSPDVSLFLHGPQGGEPDVNVCWRDDLPVDADEWAATVSVCPPSSPECMPVPIGVVRAWLAECDVSDEERSDLLGRQAPETDDEQTGERKALAWRGVERSAIISDSRGIRPGDTLVLPVTAGGWDAFGHIPDESPKDLAERAYRQSRGRVVLRLYPCRVAQWPAGDAIEELKEWVSSSESTLRRAEIRDLVRRVAEELPEDQAEAGDLRLLAKGGFEYERYPSGRGVVLSGRKRVPTNQSSPILPAMDEGEDELSRVLRDEPVPLDEHLQHVRNQVDQALACLAIPWHDALAVAAGLHDLGKADERFQAMLIGGDRDDTWAQRALWAKSPPMPLTRAARRAARRRSGLPDGFRHEMLSVQLAETLTNKLPDDPDERALVLHLIAAHHGRARPFAPVVNDDDPPEVSIAIEGVEVRLTAFQRRAKPAHRLDSGIAERFWKLTRRFGWWGLAYLEAILRLADQRASELEDRETDEHVPAQSLEVAV